MGSTMAWDSGQSVNRHSVDHHKSTDAPLRYPTSGTRECLSNKGAVGHGKKHIERLSRNFEDMSSWAGQPSIKGSSEAMRMALLTFSVIGVQYVSWDFD